MFGVVLWSSREDGTAIIWCEDHQDLAVLNLSKNQQEPRGTPEPGDLLRFETCEENGVRRAVNAINVANNGYQGLGDALRAAAPVPVVPKETQSVSSCAEILPFPWKTQRHHTQVDADREVRTGTGR